MRCKRLHKADAGWRFDAPYHLPRPSSPTTLYFLPEHVLAEGSLKRHIELKHPARSWKVLHRCYIGALWFITYCKVVSSIRFVCSWLINFFEGRKSASKVSSTQIFCWIYLRTTSLDIDPLPSHDKLHTITLAKSKGLSFPSSRWASRNSYISRRGGILWYVISSANEKGWTTLTTMVFRLNNQWYMGDWNHSLVISQQLYIDEAKVWAWRKLTAIRNLTSVVLVKRFLVMGMYL